MKLTALDPVAASEGSGASCAVHEPFGACESRSPWNRLLVFS